MALLWNQSRYASLVVVTAAICMGACSNSTKPVTVGGGANPNSFDGTQALSLAVFSPQAVDPTPTREFIAPLGSDVSLSLQISGVDPQNASIGYVTSLNGISVNTSTLMVRRPQVGDFKITLYLRDMGKCREHYGEGDDAVCNLNGRPFRQNLQGFDVVESILLSVIDPMTLGGDPSKNCQGGTGMFDDIMCNRGLVGSLVNMMMPGGIGGMMGNLGGGTTTTGTGGANTQPPIMTGPY